MTRSVATTAAVVAMGLVPLALGGAPSQAGTRHGSDGARVSQGHAFSASDGARKKKHHKKKHHKKKRHVRKVVDRSAWCWPAVPRLSTARVPAAVQFRWAGTSCTTRYRVHVSPAWYGEWPGAPWYTAWTSASARSLSWHLPSTPRPGDGMLPVAYANPVFGQLEANNASNTHATAIHKSAWVPQWSTPPAPAPGDPIRFGSYNVMLSPTGARAIEVAHNIGGHGLTMVALQESKQSTAAQVASTLNAQYAGTWDYVHARGATEYNPAQQIVYRTDLFSLVDSGVFDLANPKDSANRVQAPWAAFRARHSDATLGQAFYVTSVHFAGTSSSSAQQNAATGAAAKVVIDYLNQLTTAPTIVAGDLRYGREPWGDTPGYVPAQPTFVRAGYYDAMASQSMHGQNYSIVNSVGGNPSHAQKPNPSGLGTRSDHILMKGITGSTAYYNVVNWYDTSENNEVPSDHNLIYSDIMVPVTPGS